MRPFFSEARDRVTLHVLCASGFYVDISETCDKEYRHSSSPLLVYFAAFSNAANEIEAHWKSLDSEIQKMLIQDKYSFLRPKEYVKLLYDDQTFSRSRVYFWASGILPELEECITQNIDELNRFIEYVQVGKKYRLKDGDPVKENLCQVLAQFSIALAGLDTTRDNYRNKLSMVTGLRDAVSTFLFSSSIFGCDGQSLMDR